jgi:hypothetical protein
MADSLEYRIEAYRRLPGECAWSPAKDGTANAYHACPGIDPFGTEDAIDIRVPDGRSMAFLRLSDQAQADARLIVAALNTYQPQQAPGKEAAAPDAGLTDASQKILDIKPGQGDAGRSAEVKPKDRDRGIER